MQNPAMAGIVFCNKNDNAQDYWLKFTAPALECQVGS